MFDQSAGWPLHAFCLPTLIRGTFPQEISEKWHYPWKHRDSMRRYPSPDAKHELNGKCKKCNFQPFTFKSLRFSKILSWNNDWRYKWRIHFSFKFPSPMKTPRVNETNYICVQKAENFKGYF